ncbi:MAG TPA: hypothetical protein VFO79_11000 [Xanthomonadales bacterium]|nr:hypothetical protein [Xanthomonadales bacterium]
MKDLTHCPLVLAIEIEPGSHVPEPTLPIESAAALVDAVAIDLAKLVSGVDRLGLALAGALFDPAQVLRPGWPVFAELAGLYTREARGRGFVPQLIGFGRSAGRMAHPLLEPEAALAGGAFVVVPLVLIGPADVADAVGARLETVLVEQGLAGAATALFLNQSLSLRVAHARYMTHRDLAALTAIQLDHAGLEAAWPPIECALLTPERREIVRPLPGLAGVWAVGVMHVATQGYVAHHATHAADPAAWAAARAIERQLVALWTAHGLAPRVVALDVVPESDDTLEAVLARASAVEHGVVEILDDASRAATRLFAHVDARLGIVALSAAAPDGATWRALAHAYPRDRAGYDALRAELAARYGCDATPQKLDGLALSADGREVLAR